MKGRWVATVETPCVLVSGFQVGDLLRAAGLKPMWSNISRSWVLDLKYLGDIEVVCARNGIVLRIVGEAA